MKIIFLDIDGVLNVHEIGSVYEKDRFGHLFVQDFVNNLGRIVEETGAKIVISSTWRYAGLEIMKEMWAERGLPGEVIDITPDCMYLHNEGLFEWIDQVERGHEIDYWLSHNPEVTNYIILDDCNDFLKQQLGNFVRTANNVNHPDALDLGYGLTKECTNRAIRILNTNTK